MYYIDFAKDCSLHPMSGPAVSGRVRSVNEEGPLKVPMEDIV